MSRVYKKLWNSYLSISKKKHGKEEQIRMNTEFDYEKKKRLAEKIQRIRTQIAEENQYDFGYRLGISRNYVSQIENPNSTKFPSKALLRRIADTYNVDYDYLTGKTDPEYLSREEQMQKEKSELAHLFTPSENMVSSQLQILSQNYYRILQDEIKKITQSEEMHGYLYNLYISNVLSYSNVLFSTLKSAKEYLNRKEEVPSELFEACLKEIKEKVKEKEN